MIATIRECIRCRRSHVNLIFKTLSNVTDEYTYWAICPKLNQPILMKYEVVKNKEGKQEYRDYK